MKRINPDKITRWLSLSVLLIGLVNACAPPNDDRQKQTQNATAAGGVDYKSKKDLSGIKVGYCSPSLNAPFYAALNEAIRRNVVSMGMSFVTAEGQDDISKQIAAVEDLIANNINVLILNPLDQEALVPITKAATRNGIAVFIVDSKIAPQAEYVASVQANNRGNGSLIGSWVVDKLGSQPLKIALLSGAKGNPVGQERREGMLTGIASAQLTQSGRTTFEVVAQGWGNWSNNGGLKAMEDILVAHPDVNVLLAENDAMALGAMKAINEAGKTDQITIVAIDGQKEAYQLIRAGKMGSTAVNSPGSGQTPEWRWAIAQGHLHPGGRRDQGQRRKILQPTGYFLDSPTP